MYDGEFISYEITLASYTEDFSLKTLSSFYKPNNNETKSARRDNHLEKQEKLNTSLSSKFYSKIKILFY